MKIAFLGNLPAATVLPEGAIRPSHRGVNHPAPWVAALLPALAKLTDYKLRVILPQRAVLKRTVVEHNGVEYEGLPMQFTERWNPQTFYAVRSIAAHRALKQYKPDLIHAYGMETGNATVALRTGLPVSCFIQGIIQRYFPYIEFTGKYRRRFQRRIEHSAVKKLRWLVAETEFAKEWVRENNPDAHVQIIPHPTRRDFFDKGVANGSKHVVSIGGIDNRKAMDIAVRAFKHIRDQDARLTIVGGGGGLQELRNLVEREGLSSRIELTGALPTEKVIEKLKSASIFTITSRMDTSPNVLSEAHALGLPVIGTRSGGIPEMIDDGVDGYLIDVDDVQALANRIDSLCVNPELGRKMGQVGREKVKILNDPDVIAKSHVDFFEHIRRDLGVR